MQSQKLSCSFNFVCSDPWMSKDKYTDYRFWHCFFALACALVPHSGLCRSPLARALDLVSQKKNKRLLSKNGEALSLLEVGLRIKGGGRLHSACCNTVPGGYFLLSNTLMGMRRWMRSHFHDWIDYNGLAISLELLEWDRTFSGFGGSEN